MQPPGCMPPLSCIRIPQCTSKSPSELIYFRFERIYLRVIWMIFCPKDGILEAHLAPLGAHLAPEGTFGGFRDKNVDFPIGKVTFFQNSHPCLGKSDDSEKKSKKWVKNHQILGTMSFPYVRVTISVSGRRKRGMCKRCTRYNRFWQMCVLPRREAKFW